MANKKKLPIDFTLFSKVQLSAFISLMVISLILGVGIPIFLSSNMLLSVKTTREYKANELSDEDLISPIAFTFIDEESTEKLKDEAEAKVIPYFTYSYSATMEMKNTSENLYSLIDEYSKTGEISQDISEAMKGYIILATKIGDGGEKVAALTRETVDYFIRKGVFQESDIAHVLQEGKKKIVVESSTDLPYSLENKEIGIGECTTLTSLRSSIYQYLVQNYSNLAFDEMQLIADLSQMIIKPNIIYDEIYTKIQVDSARNRVEPVVVKIEKGDYILKTDTLVTEEQLNILEILNTKKVFNISPLSVLPRVILVAFVLIFWFIYEFSLVPYSYRKAQYTLIMLSVIDVCMLFAFFISWTMVNKGRTEIASFMPFFIIGMVGTTITNRRIYGLAGTLVFAALYTLWPTSELMSFFYIVMAASAVNISIKNDKGRFHTIVLCLLCMLYSALITMFFGIYREIGIMDILVDSIAATVNILLSFIVYSILLPVLEKVFNIPTKQRLMELAYNDNAVLTQLSQVAQGTYNHVKNVSDLAYAGAVAIGANAELTLVGARYHDIGKMVHPEYFIENQNDKNAHDSISSQLSRSIIKSHVRLGTEKGKEIGLPQEVLDIIGEHHGNDLIRFFYNEAVKNASKNNVVEKEDFMYDGNVPSTKESAIVMLADCVEAATRTINRPNHQKYEKFINSIISDKIAHGQLDNSNLTMTDLKKLKEAFIPPLFGRDHHRISYDNDKD
ncbi:MAG: HDIG domain-containing metalloprotein [Candidatus Ornithospirochaeta sp.]